MSAIIPIPKIPITIRPGTMEDISFLDSLQKMHTKQVGFMPTAQFEGKIKLGHVLIAEEGLTTDYTDDTDKRLDLNSSVKSVKSVVQPLGYCIGNDQYFKRDDVGIIYQMNVLPGHQRGLIGASLLKAQFERSAYGCRLYCCWCAQDIEANHFWESMGFVPLAFRTGSRTKGSKGTPRVHIFWQKRIRQGDQTTPWWFPAKTDGGAIREDRLVLPIPPGMHWSDAKPIVLPGMEEASQNQAKKLPAPRQTKSNLTPILKAPKSTLGRLQFAPPTPPKPEKPAREAKAPRQKVKADPKFLAAARELRDRWLEKVQEDPSLLLSRGKYDVARALAAPAQRDVPQLPNALAA